MQWDKTFGGSNNDCLRTMAATKDSGTIAGGYSYSNISGEKQKLTEALHIQSEKKAPFNLINFSV